MSHQRQGAARLFAVPQISRERHGHADHELENSGSIAFDATAIKQANGFVSPKIPHLPHLNATNPKRGMSQLMPPNFAK